MIEYFRISLSRPGLHKSFELNSPENHMNPLTNLIHGLKSLFQKPRIDRELDEELQSYLEASAADKQRSGLSRNAARYAAKVEMGSSGSVKHQVWTSRWESALDSLFADLRLGIRALIKSPGFTLVALLSLALGIGANTAIFTLLNAILLRPLPVQSPSELVLFGNGRAAGSTGSFPNGSWRLFSYPFFSEFSQRQQSFLSVAAVNSTQFTIHASIAGSAYERTHVNLVSGTYFSVLGIPPFLGRTISNEDNKAAGAGPVAVASYGWFQRHFNGDPAALGKVIRIQSHDYTIVGVAKPGFTGITVGESADLWIPLSMEKEISPGWNGLDKKFFQSLLLFARLKPGVTSQQATTASTQLFQQILRSDYVGSTPSQKEFDSIQHARIDMTSAANGVSQLRFQFSLPLKILMTIVALVLLIACANIANMLLARGVARAREIAVRMAIGATRRRIVVQLLTESAVLAFTGAALGVALAWKASAALLNTALATSEPVPIDLTPGLPVLGFTLAVTVFTVLLFGMIPAFKATRLELTPALKEGRGGGTASNRSKLSRGLIAGQIALSVVLLVAATLFLRSLINLTSTDTGFDKHNVLVFSMDSSTANLREGDPQEIKSVQLQEQIESRVQTIPGVKADAFSFFTFDQGSWTDLVLFQGLAKTQVNTHEVSFNNIDNGFFATMGIPLRAGRIFNDHDTKTSPKVAIINETMARRFFPSGSPIGHHFGIGDDPTHASDIEVVGVVKDAKYNSLGEEAQMAAYLPCTQNAGFYGNFSVRYAPGADTHSLVAQVRRVVAQINPNILINNVESLEEQVDRSIATQSLIARLSTFFGALAVFLAAIGIYGLMSYSVARRTNEIGIRLALGAQTGTLLWMVLRETLILLAAGLIVGVPITLASTRILKSQLYQLSPLDPLAIGSAVAIIAAMTVVAAWLPARRASKVDPMVALRCD
jgi:predicted permease